MASIKFSKAVQKKLAELQIRLTEIGGIKKGKERMAKVMSAVSNLEKYYILYTEKNYFFYYIADDVVYVVEMYDEREDVAAKFLGIHTTSQETLDYWNE